MSARKSKAPQSEATFHVGDRVRFLRGGDNAVEGVIIEDRGPIGIGKRHLYRILYRVDPYTDEVTTERPAVDLTLLK